MSSNPGQPDKSAAHKSMLRPGWRSWLLIFAVIFAAGLAAYAIWWTVQGAVLQNPKIAEPIKNDVQPTQPQPIKVAPTLSYEVLVSQRDHIWDIGFLPTGEMLFTERAGHVIVYSNGQEKIISKIADVLSLGGEGGLLGLEVDPLFSQNRYIYTCLNSKAGDIRVVRWKVKANVLDGLEDRNDIITGIPATSGGRHSGCRVKFGIDGYLWIGTGDSAQNDIIPQSPTSLGGKILRTDRDGRAAPGNLGGQFDPRIFSYGHRNTQGLAFYKQPELGVVGVSTEHGSYIDDEVNLLVHGNFGWSPGPGYNELGVSMTDKQRFPNAIEAIWSSGNPTQAPSGATFLYGEKWQLWEGWLAVAMLKAKHLKILHLQENKVVEEIKMFEGEFGRLRAVTIGPDQALYISTDNSGNDKIIKIIPK